MLILSTVPLSNLCQQPVGVFVPKSVASLPFLAKNLSCGFPNPADDFIEKRLDLNSLMVANDQATFFFQVQGDSMRDLGLTDGSYLVVDRSISPRSGHVVVAIVNQEYTVKTLIIDKTGIELRPANDQYQPLRFAEQDELIVWGVVTGWVHKLAV